jgi:hypothetical protein
MTIIGTEFVETRYALSLQDNYRKLSIKSIDRQFWLHSKNFQTLIQGNNYEPT